MILFLFDINDDYYDFYLHVCDHGNYCDYYDYFHVHDRDHGDVFVIHMDHASH